MTRFSDAAETTLRAAGWSPGRSATAVLASSVRTLAPAFSVFDVARSAILEFGGLTLNLKGAGVDMALARVDFDPAAALGEEERFRAAESVVSSRLYPWGEYDNGHFFVAISESGAVYLVGVVLIKMASSIDLAIEAFVAGRRESGDLPAGWDHDPKHPTRE
jgi:hypothetical protein